MANERRGACAIKEKRGGVGCRCVLVIFVMGGGYGGREAQEAGCKNIEEEGERAGGTFSESSTFFVALPLPGLLPNEAEAWGWRKRCRGCHVTKAFLFPTLLLAMKMMQGFAFEAGWQNMTRTGWKTRLILRGVERVATSKRHSI